ncbi:unnamed protein product [Fraxinus pennsylvanica]|uniref:Uncharacterized protein n=1 Tax=Fraxinus pennsylvanica TaxID=56036 RepID=A0AAD2DWE5_9LAMI|nr:unnamed protein product [Fraxinus pennsylvanica]
MADIEPLLWNIGTSEVQTADHEEQASKGTSTKSKTARLLRWMCFQASAFSPFKLNTMKINKITRSHGKWATFPVASSIQLPWKCLSRNRTKFGRHEVFVPVARGMERINPRVLYNIFGCSAILGYVTFLLVRFVCISLRFIW